ncbi:hypothetical protein A1O1_00456 [Capronia coronata CBS 617.96]|uniref:Methyltransferase type 11 domain-containing protein n=1 Tax=Capronia coronata CBS 617.96 TaxID=1182541 RepID=W9Z1B7_9EURO|nr:uncharacterized protein A1O1_00456 [Capronia coronata CBS 617.96]EXJ95336.1 hypothetical protein A1O1_00456 [Capronia coronata CBS 617.96]
MASTEQPSQRPAPRDKTFRNYDSSSAAAYAQYRPPYPNQLIDIIIDKHVSTGGGLDLLLDVGCGPGTATRSLAPRFTHAVAADPGQSMVETARKIPSTTKSGTPVRFEMCEAEKVSSLLPVLQEVAGTGSPECVDLITAAAAAHWFDLPRFYGEAAKILKPGGSIIFWCTKSGYCSPDTPNAEKLTRLFQEFEDTVASEFEQPGNRLARGLYAGLTLPWDAESEAATDKESGDGVGVKLSEVFPKEEFQRLEFNKDGHVPPGEQFLVGRKFTLDQVKMALGTVSPITRWREAYKDKIASGETEDCVEKLVRQMKEILEEVPEGKGRDWIEGGSAVVVLIIKKRK